MSNGCKVQELKTSDRRLTLVLAIPSQIRQVKSPEVQCLKHDIFNAHASTVEVPALASLDVSGVPRMV